MITAEQISAALLPVLGPSIVTISRETFRDRNDVVREKPTVISVDHDNPEFDDPFVLRVGSNALAVNSLEWFTAAYLTREAVLNAQRQVRIWRQKPAGRPHLEDKYFRSLRGKPARPG